MPELGFRLECEFVYNGDRSPEGGGRAGRGCTRAGAGCLSALVVQARGIVVRKWSLKRGGPTGEIPTTAQRASELSKQIGGTT